MAFPPPLLSFTLRQQVFPKSSLDACIASTPLQTYVPSYTSLLDTYLRDFFWGQFTCVHKCKAQMTGGRFALCFCFLIGISATFDGWGYLKSQRLSYQVWGKDWAEKNTPEQQLFFLSTLLASWPSYSRLFPACSMKSYCIIVIIYKEKPGLRIPFILDLGKVTCMLQGQENNERVPQHTYIMPGLSCSHSVLGSQQ